MATRIYKANTTGHCNLCNGAIALGQHITWPRRGDTHFRVHQHCNQDCDSVGCYSNAPKTETKPEITENIPTMPASENQNTADLFSILANALTPMIESRINAKVDADTVKEIVNDAIKDIPRYDSETIAEMVATEVSKSATVSIKIEREDAPSQTFADVHFLAPRMIKLVARRKHIYAHGPAGGFKSTSAKLAAEANGLRFAHITLGPLSVDSKLFGYPDANGQYVQTEFFSFWKDGGVYCGEELDNWNPALCNMLNTGLENGTMYFPGYGTVERHKDFVFIGTGNTNGRGASRNHADRRQFDGAFSERFKYIYWAYDEKLERKIALSINPNCADAYAWVLSVRQYCQANHPGLIVSPRASFAIAEFMDTDVYGNRSELLESVLWKGFDKTSVNSILTANPVNW